MCGILVIISGYHVLLPSEQHLALIKRRGPDYYGNLLLKGCGSRPYRVWISASVLSLRGQDVATQPLLHDSGCKLCWNGELWRYGGVAVAAESDGPFMLAALVQAAQSGQDHEDAIVAVMNAVEGPCAFVFFDAIHDRLYFGRDPLGRRSLVWSAEGSAEDGSQMIILASVADSSHSAWEELDTDHVHILDLTARPSRCQDEAAEMTRRGVRKRAYSTSKIVPSLNSNLPQDGVAQLCCTSPSVSRLEMLLRDSISLRINSIPRSSELEIRAAGETATESVTACPVDVVVGGKARVAVLFSGGLDCSVLTKLIDAALQPTEAIDLLNAAFYNPRIHGPEPAAHADAERINDAIRTVVLTAWTARKSLAELQRLCPGRQFNLVTINVPYSEFQLHKDEIMTLMHPHRTEMDLSICAALYFAARGTGDIDSIIDEVELPTAQAQRSSSQASALMSSSAATKDTRLHSTVAGHAALIAELDLDLQRLGKRNLGRDDRVMSNWGREARYPFLDERVVNWAAHAPIWEKCGFGLPDTPDSTTANIEPGRRCFVCLRIASA
ncbi:hypothetical protein MRB53_037347 [Persea americana]|nr:hypothetical protein MRB53_037347 [Persea americana]